MTINIPPVSLGQSWVPKLGAIFGLMAALCEMMPTTLPGADVIKPWGLFLGSAGVAIIGFSTRQSNKTSEQMGVQPMYNPDAKLAVNPPPSNPPPPATGNTPLPPTPPGV